MMLHAVVLSALIARCAPHVPPATMAAIVAVESGGDPLAIGDNTTRRSYQPPDRATAEALAHRLIAAGHSIDLGIAQINDANLAHLALTVRTAFDPCANLGAGSEILAQDYAIATRRFGAGQVALRHAIGMYNAGSLDAGASYVRRVMLAAGMPPTLALNPRLIAVREAMRSPFRVRAPSAASKSRRVRQDVVTPARAPIFVRIAQAQRMRVATDAP
jgi:type IV secretion system protein VirB1